MVAELKKQRELQKELMEKYQRIFNEYGAESALLKPIQVRLDEVDKKIKEIRSKL